MKTKITIPDEFIVCNVDEYFSIEEEYPQIIIRLKRSDKKGDAYFSNLWWNRLSMDVKLYLKYKYANEEGNPDISRIKDMYKKENDIHD